MSYQVVIPKSVQKELDRVDSRYRPKIIAVLESLEDNPYLGKKLSGEHDGKRSCRVWPYRIIYTIRHQELVILVIAIGHRQGVYR